MFYIKIFKKYLNQNMPDDKQVDFTKDITIIHNNGATITFPASTIESQLVIPTQKIYEESLVLKQYIDDEYYKAMFLLQDVDNSIKEVSDILDFNDKLKPDIRSIPEENVDIKELFEKFHPEYFDSTSSKSNYMDGVPRIVFYNHIPQISGSGGGGGKSGWSFAFIIPVITIPLASGCSIM